MLRDQDDILDALNWEDIFQTAYIAAFQDTFTVFNTGFQMLNVTHRMRVGHYVVVKFQEDERWFSITSGSKPEVIS